MKKILVTTVLLAGLSFLANAQNNYVIQPDSAKLYFSPTLYGGVWDFRCSYDLDGLLTNLKVEVVYGEDCVVRRYEYGYDSNHNVVHSEYTGYDCTYPGIQSRTDNVYLHNLIKSQTRYVFSMHRQWAFVDSTTFQYDENKRLILKETFNADRIHISSVHYEYGNYQKVITTEKLNNNVWEPVKRETQTYSPSENLLNVMTETYSNGAFSNSTLISYSYDELNHRTGVLTQKWENELWENVKIVVYDYDDNGHLILATLKNWQDGAFVDANRAVYELNESGYPTVVSFKRWNGDEWVEGAWVSDFYVYSESYLSRQNKELCATDVRRIEIYYADTPMPNYDVDEYPTEQDFATLHPNPTTGRVNITGKDLKAAEVINTFGQCVATVTGEGEQFTVDISSLPVGIYLVNITDAEGRKCVKKVIKE